MKKIVQKMFFMILTVVLVGIIVGCNGVTTPTCETNEVVVDGKCVVEELPDETVPVFGGTQNIHYVIGEEAPDYLDGVTATDDVDGDVTSSIVVDDSLVDLTVEGTYDLIYTVVDEAGNEASVTVEVIVSEYQMTDEEIVTLDLAVVTEDNLPFTFTGPNGSRYTWASSHTNIVTNKGTVIRPPVGGSPVEVTITVTAKSNAHYETKDIVLTIEPQPEIVVTSSVLFDFVGTSDEYVVENKTGIELFYVNEGTLPYIDVETYFKMIEGAVEPNLLEFVPIGDDRLEISYEVDYEDFNGVLVTETYSALLDFTANTLTVPTFDFFGGYVASTESDYGEGLNYIDADYVDSEEVVIPLGDYRFDIAIHQEGEQLYYLMPLHVVNLLFAHGLYYDVYYNGDMLYGIDTFSLSGPDADDLALQEQIRTSSYNDLNMADDTREAAYHFMALAFDYFYGLKEDQQVDTYYDVLTGYTNAIAGGTDLSLYKGMFEFVYGLDDLHTSHIFTGYYSSPDYGFTLGLSDLGPNTQAYYQGYWRVDDWISEKFPTGVPFVRVLEDGVTAVIYIDGFSIDTPNDVFRALNNLDPAIENVVLDLSNNGGGNLGAVLRIFGYMTENAVQYHSQNPADGSAVTYYIESDYVAFNYNWYMISSSVTFSAANLMVSMAKELGIATIVGQDSSGGASSIGVIMPPGGSALMISTNNVLSTRVGNELDGYEYLSIEYGIEVEYPMLNPTSDAELLAIIQSINEGNITE